MTETIHLGAESDFQKIDHENGIIYGVCVLGTGAAKGHGFSLDDESLNTFLALAKESPDGIKTRFGADHDAGASDINGSLKNFRKEGRDDAEPVWAFCLWLRGY
jgi:hypothetical protein